MNRRDATVEVETTTKRRSVETTLWGHERGSEGCKYAERQENVEQQNVREPRECDDAD